MKVIGWTLTIVAGMYSLYLEAVGLYVLWDFWGMLIGFAIAPVTYFVFPIYVLFRFGDWTIAIAVAITVLGQCIVMREASIEERINNAKNK